MNRMSVGTALIGLVCLLSVGCASKEAAMQPTVGEPSSSSGVTARGSDISSDALHVCVARIPKDSSEGARMVAEQGCREQDALHQSVAGAAIAKSGNRASAGTQGDSLEACMGHIPGDATVGQRMLAEESCKRDQTLHH